MNTNTAANKVTVQIAVEAIINNPGDGFTVSDAEIVLADGIAHNVADLYLDMLREVIDYLSSDQMGNRGV